MATMSQQTSEAGSIPVITLPRRLVIALDEGGVTVPQMAKAIGYSEGQTRNYLKGRQVPRRGTISEWAFRCGVDPDWLRDGIDSTSPDDGGAAHETSESHVVNARSTAQVITFPFVAEAA